jgi:hypothetical protein
MKRFLIGALILAASALCWAALAEEPAAQPENSQTHPAAIPADETPQQALVRGAKVMDRFDVDAAVELYEYSGSLEKQLVKTYCNYAVEVTRVEQAMKKRFGEKQSDAMLHAIGEYAESDLPKATYKTDGDTATVQYADETEPGLHMIRVNDVWKIDVHAEFKDVSDDDLKEEIKEKEALTEKIKPVAKKIEQGKFPTSDALIDEMKQIFASQNDVGPAGK